MNSMNPGPMQGFEDLDPLAMVILAVVTLFLLVVLPGKWTGLD